MFKTPELKAEAAAINYKMRHIAIPNDGESEVDYSIHPLSEKLAAVTVVPKGREFYEGPRHRTKHFDLSVPRQLAPYDKMGGKIMLQAIKRHVFGDPKIC